MRIAAGIEYLGTNFHGWQLQRQGVRTVQLVVESALSKIANEFIRVSCSGRTDAGVHAKEQIIHFDTKAKRTNKQWLFGANVNLPKDVNFIWVKKVDKTFHARFDAIARAYEFKILNHSIRSSLNANTHLWEPRQMDINKMQEAANKLLGEHDFSCFRGSFCQAKSAVKNIQYINIEKTNNIITIKIKANAFLHHMVRNIVGTLMKIGKGDRSVSWIEEVLASKDRCKAGPTISSNGLYFVKAFYDKL